MADPVIQAVTTLAYAATGFVLVATVAAVWPRRAEKRLKEALERKERTIGELKKRIARLEERLAEKDAECYQKMQRLCGLERDAAALLDALSNGDVAVFCRDGRPAAIVGGRVICLERSSS